MSETERLEILLPKHINTELVNLASKTHVPRVPDRMGVCVSVCE